MATRNWQHERSVAVRPGLAGKRGSTAEMVRGYIFMSRSFVSSSTLPKRHWSVCSVIFTMRKPMRSPVVKGR